MGVASKSLAVFLLYGRAGACNSRSSIFLKLAVVTACFFLMSWIKKTNGSSPSLMSLSSARTERTTVPGSLGGPAEDPLPPPPPPPSALVAKRISSPVRSEMPRR